MIQVTRLDHSPIVINALMIVFIEQSHDTVVSLINHDKLVVRETAEEIVERVVAYLQRIHAVPYAIPFIEPQGA
jgi:flagellar protein FlbD